MTTAPNIRPAAPLRVLRDSPQGVQALLCGADASTAALPPEIERLAPAAGFLQRTTER